MIMLALFGVLAYIIIRVLWDKVTTVPEDRSRMEETIDGTVIFYPFMGDGIYGYCDRKYREGITGGRKEFELYKLYPSANGECKYYYFDTFKYMNIVKDRNNMIKDQYRPRWVIDPVMAIHRLIPSNYDKIPPTKLIMEFGTENLCMSYIEKEREKDKATRRMHHVVR